MRRGLISTLICATLLSSCVVHTRDGRVILPGERQASGRYTWSPFGDLLETLLAPVFVPLAPVFWGLGWWSGKEAGWNAVALLLPGFCRHQCAFLSWLEPARGFRGRFSGSQGALAAELGRCSGRSVVVVPQPGRSAPRERPDTLEQLAEEAALDLVEVEGVLVLHPKLDAGVPVHPATFEQRFGPPVVMAPDAWPAEPSWAADRGGVVVLRESVPGRTLEVIQAANERRWRPQLPLEEDCRGPRVRLCAQDEPLSAAAARLSALGGRPVAVVGGDTEQPVSFHLEELPWEQALAALAWATDRRLELDGRGGATLQARNRISAAIRWAHPLAALELLARAAGRRLILPDPLPALAPTALHLSQVPADEGLELAAELLGFALEPDASGALAVRPSGSAIRCGRVPFPLLDAAWVDRRFELETVIREQLARALSGEPAPIAPRPNEPWLCGLSGLGPARSRAIAERVAGSGRREWELLERRLEPWLPTWQPALVSEVVGPVANALVARELATLDHALQNERPGPVLASVPELTELAARLARRDRAAAERLLEGVRTRAAQAEGLAALFTRAPAVVQGTLRGPGLALAIVDGRVLAPGEPLVDRAGVPWLSAALVGVPGLDRVELSCHGHELMRRLPE